MKTLFLLLLCLPLLAGCSDSAKSVTAPTQAAGSAKDAFADLIPPSPPNQLAKQVAELEKRIDTLEGALAATELRITQMANQDRPVPLHPDSKGYSKIQTDLGPLLVSTEDVQPYLDGYKLKCSIGNPGSGDQVGCKVSLIWGPAFDSALGSTNFETYLARWKSQQRTNVTEILTPLIAGAWNPVDLVIAPAKPDELRNLEVQIQSSVIRLRALKADGR
jgi:hypothetical protein